MRETFAVADGITAIDTKMIERYLVTSAYLLDADEPILVETGPATSADAVDSGLHDVGVSRDGLAHVVVTHIHLDHAGGVGTLAGRYPNAMLWVHERGARHLANPTKLVASAARVFGEDRMRRYFGEMIPAPADRLRVLEDGDVIDVGGRSLDVIETPGHASHHLCLVDSRTGAVFTGDALGVHLPDAGVLRPATPPPEFDIELACESIERIRARAESILLLSHFGPVADVDRVCALAADRIRRWGDIVRRALAAGEDAERVTSLLGEEGAAEYLRDSGRPIDMEAYDVLSSVRANADGLIRYWRKRTEREGEDVLRTAEAAPPTSPG